MQGSASVMLFLIALVQPIKEYKPCSKSQMHSLMRMYSKEHGVRPIAVPKTLREHAPTKLMKKKVPQGLSFGVRRGYFKRGDQEGMSTWSFVSQDILLGDLHTSSDMYVFLSKDDGIASLHPHVLDPGLGASFFDIFCHILLLYTASIFLFSIIRIFEIP